MKYACVTEGGKFLAVIEDAGGKRLDAKEGRSKFEAMEFRDTARNEGVSAFAHIGNPPAPAPRQRSRPPAQDPVKEPEVPAEAVSEAEPVHGTDPEQPAEEPIESMAPDTKKAKKPKTPRKTKK